MTEQEELILKFLKRNYSIEIAKAEKWGNYDYEFYIIDIFYPCNNEYRRVGIHEFICKLEIIFADWKFDTNDSVSRVFDRWVKSFWEKTVEILSDYLKDCSAELGDTCWYPITSEGERFTVNKLVNKFKNELYGYFIEKYFDDWFTNKICDVSEQMMGEYL